MPVGRDGGGLALSECTTFHIGGLADRAIGVACDIGEIQQALRDIHYERAFFLGGGSNVLAADHGVADLIMYFDDETSIASIGPGSIEVSANTPLERLVNYCLENDLAGVEQLAGIPGSVGGAVVQNAGAYDHVMASPLRSVTAVDRLTGRARTHSKDTCDFGYRHSVFKTEGDWLVTSCILDLTRSAVAKVERLEVRAELVAAGWDPAAAPLVEIAAAVTHIRSRRDHLVSAESPSAGSFFVNPDPPADPIELAALEREFARRRDQLLDLGASWLRAESQVIHRSPTAPLALNAGYLISTAITDDLAQAYAPNRVIGRLRLGSGSPNTIVNHREATAAEVIDLARAMQAAVHSAYQIALRPEVVLLGLSL